MTRHGNCEQPVGDGDGLISCDNSVGERSRCTILFMNPYRCMKVIGITLSIAYIVFMREQNARKPAPCGKLVDNGLRPARRVNDEHASIMTERE